MLGLGLKANFLGLGGHGLEDFGLGLATLALALCGLTRSVPLSASKL